jgi:hypothetical protein
VPGELRVGLEAVNRSDLGEQLGGGDCGAAGQFKQPRRDLGCPRFQLLVEVADRAV